MLMIFLSIIDDPKDIPVFETLYDEYNVIVYNMALNISGNPYDADEAAQEAWVSIAKNIKRIRRDKEVLLTAYILKVAENSAKNVIRQKKRMLFISDIEECNTPLENTVIDKVIGDEILQKVISFIKTLPVAYSDVLTMHYLFDQSARQIALETNQKYETVRKRLNRGTKLLRVFLEKEEIK